MRYAENQQRLIDMAQKSTAAAMLLNTDDMDWDRYARDIFELTETNTGVNKE